MALNLTVRLLLGLPTPSALTRRAAPAIDAWLGCLDSAGRYRELMAPLPLLKISTQLRDELQLDLYPASRTIPPTRRVLDLLSGEGSGGRTKRRKKGAGSDLLTRGLFPKRRSIS